MEQILSCPLCGATKFHQYLKTIDYSTSKEEFTIVSCDSCDFLFTNPRPNEKEIGKYYESPKYISHTNSKKGLFGRAYQIVRKQAVEKKMRWINKHTDTGSLVDYGCGTGEFLNYAQESGWNTIGFEIAELAREQAIENYGLDARDPEGFGELPNGSVDVITMWHVLEHLPNLESKMNELVSKLKTGGLLVLALPNPESWDAARYGKFWAAWDVPIHFYHFKKKNIDFIATKFGLSLVETINMPFDAYYVSLLSEEYKTGKKRWLSASINGLKSNLKAGKDNASSLTYILKKL